MIGGVTVDPSTFELGTVAHSVRHLLPVCAAAIKCPHFDTFSRYSSAGRRRAVSQHRRRDPRSSLHA